MFRSATGWLCLALCGAPPALGSGFYNMPTDARQCLGVGFGPGYHAPMVLVRPWKAKTASQGITWVHAPLRPAASYEAAIYSSHNHGLQAEQMQTGGHFAAPSVLVAPAYAAPTPSTPIPPRSEVVPRPPVNSPAKEPASPSDRLQADPIYLPSAWQRTQNAIR